MRGAAGGRRGPPRPERAALEARGRGPGWGPARGPARPRPPRAPRARARADSSRTDCRRPSRSEQGSERGVPPSATEGDVALRPIRVLFHVLLPHTHAETQDEHSSVIPQKLSGSPISPREKFRVCASWICPPLQPHTVVRSTTGLLPLALQPGGASGAWTKPSGWCRPLLVRSHFGCGQHEIVFTEELNPGKVTPDTLITG